jgi:N utilization substance protein B
MRRSDQRRDAAFAIYQHEVTGRPLEELLGDGKPFTKAIAEGTFEHLPELDEKISLHARGWRIERIAPLEKAIMRVALFEISYRDDVPTPVAIDEAVTITQKYCGADAPGFVNGILSAASGGRPADLDAVAAAVAEEPDAPGDESAFPDAALTADVAGEEVSDGTGTPDGTEAAA